MLYYYIYLAATVNAVFFCDYSDGDHGPNSARQMDMALLLGGSKNPPLAPSPMTNSTQW